MVRAPQGAGNSEQYVDLHRRGALSIFSTFNGTRGREQQGLFNLDAQGLHDNYPSNVTPGVVGNLVESLLGYFLVRHLGPDHPAKVSKISYVLQFGFFDSFPLVWVLNGADGMYTHWMTLNAASEPQNILGQSHGFVLISLSCNS